MINVRVRAAPAPSYLHKLNPEEYFLPVYPGVREGNSYNFRLRAAPPSTRATFLMNGNAMLRGKIVRTSPSLFIVELIAAPRENRRWF